jgi:hypothetical protein
MCVGRQAIAPAQVLERVKDRGRERNITLITLMTVITLIRWNGVRPESVRTSALVPVPHLPTADHFRRFDSVAGLVCMIGS